MTATRTRKVLVVAGLFAALTACGQQDSDNGVATAGGQATTQNNNNAASSDDGTKFAECMRKHGVDMADPKPGQSDRINVKGDRATMRAAMQACKQYAPKKHPGRPNPEMQKKLQQMAECMRANGVPKFPDPQPDGGIRIDAGSGLDPDSPTFKKAMDKCRSKFDLPNKGGGQVGGKSS